jgi:HlyD family secretion protein
VSGSVEANVTALCAFQIAGRVARVPVEEGQAVGKGQVLAELDSTDYRNAYDAAQAQADAAQAVDRKAKQGPRSQELEQARIDFDQWQDQYNRMKYLYDHKSLAANDFKKIEAGYQAAQQRYEMAKQGTRVEDKEAASAQYRAASAQNHEAQKRLGDSRLRAPIAGFVGMRRIDVGDTVGAGTPVISVLDLNPVKVRVAIPEAEIGKVHEGARATVTIPSLDNRPFEGKVETVGVADLRGEDCSGQPGARTARRDGGRGTDFLVNHCHGDDCARRCDCARSEGRGTCLRVLAHAAASVCAPRRGGDVAEQRSGDFERRQRG